MYCRNSSSEGHRLHHIGETASGQPTWTDHPLQVLRLGWGRQWEVASSEVPSPCSALHLEGAASAELAFVNSQILTWKVPPRRASIRKLNRNSNVGNTSRLLCTCTSIRSLVVVRACSWYVCKYAYACVSACMHVCNVCTYVCINAISVHICVYACMFVFT